MRNHNLSFFIIITLILSLYIQKDYLVTPSINVAAYTVVANFLTPYSFINNILYMIFTKYVLPHPPSPLKNISI
jgi:hypothetical protein